MACASQAAATPYSSSQDFSVDIPGLAVVQRAVKDFKDKFAPAPVDKEIVDRLFARLVREGPSFESQRKIGENIELFDVTLAGPKEEPAPKGSAKLAVARTQHQYIVGSMGLVTRNPEGILMEKWTFLVSLDGQLQRVNHIVVSPGTGKAGFASIKLNERLAPSDPDVLKLWDKAAQGYLSLATTIAI